MTQPNKLRPQTKDILGTSPIGYQRCHGVYDKRARYENLIHSFIQDFKLVKLSIWYAMYEMPMTFVVRVLGFEADFMFMAFGQEIHLGKL